MRPRATARRSGGQGVEIICGACGQPFADVEPCGRTHALIARELETAATRQRELSADFTATRAKIRRLEREAETSRAAAKTRSEASKPSKLPRLRSLRLAHHVYGDVDNAWLVVRDPYAGRKNVYTVYRIRLGGDKGTCVIGRELPLPHARKIVREDMAATSARSRE